MHSTIHCQLDETMKQPKAPKPKLGGTPTVNLQLEDILYGSDKMLRTTIMKSFKDYTYRKYASPPDKEGFAELTERALTEVKLLKAKYSPRLTDYNSRKQIKGYSNDEFVYYFSIVGYKKPPKTSGRVMRPVRYLSKGKIYVPSDFEAEHQSLLDKFLEEQGKAVAY